MSLDQAMKKLARHGEAEEEEEQVLISQLRKTRERLELTKPIPSLPLVDPKEKAPETPPASPTRRERIPKPLLEAS